MLKPRRKHFGVNILSDSTAGRAFLDVASALAGHGFQWTALERDRGGAHFFHVAGSRDDVLLVEAKEVAQRDEWVAATALVQVWDDPAYVLHAECTTHGWDPTLFAALHRLEMPTQPTTRVKRRWGQIRVERADRRDRLSVATTSPTTPPPQVAGVPWDVVLEVGARHGLRSRQQPAELTVEPPALRPPESAVELLEERNGRDRRTVWLHRPGHGDLVIEGQDTGPRVQRAWGRDEYEWAKTISAASIPALATALGGTEPDDALPLLAWRFSDRPMTELTAFLATHRVPTRFWDSSP